MRKALSLLVLVSVVACSAHDGGGQRVGVTGQSTSALTPLQLASDALSTKATGAPSQTILPDPPNTASVVNPPLGDAKMTVDDRGSAHYHVPIWVPPGRFEIEPELSLDYDSTGGDGLAGEGWILTGLPSVTRCHNPRSTGNTPRPMSFDASDSFCLDGEVLIQAVDGTYRKFRDDYSQILPLNPDDLGPTSFLEKKKDGRNFYYGAVDEHPRNTPSGQSTVRTAWGLSQVIDRSGNYMNVSYTRQPPPAQPAYAFTPDEMELLPTEIDYTGNSGVFALPGVPSSNLPPLRSVKLYYDQGRGDARIAYNSGVATAVASRLVKLEMYGPNPTTSSLLRTFSLAYKTSDSTGRSLLQRIEECDGQPPTPFNTAVLCRQQAFSYSAGSTQFDHYPGLPNPGVIGLEVGTNAPVYLDFYSLDIDNDGKSDILYVPADPTQPFGVARNFHFRLSTGTGLGADVETPIPWSTTLQIADFNGDGHPDILLSMQDLMPPGHSIYLATNSGGSWNFTLFMAGTDDPTQAPKTIMDGFLRVTAADLDGDRFPDLIMHNALGSPMSAINAGGPNPWLAPAARFAEGPSFDANLANYGLVVADINGDGQSEILSATDSPSNYFGVTFTGCPNSGVSGQCPNGSYAIGARADTITKINGIYETTPPQYPSNWQLMACGVDAPNNQVSFSIGSPKLFVDLNGDGLDDVLTEQSGPNLAGISDVLVLQQNTGVGFQAAVTAFGLDNNPSAPEYFDCVTQMGWNENAKAVVRAMDTNEDGIAEVVRRYVAPTSSPIVSYRYALGAMVPTNLAVSVQDDPAAQLHAGPFEVLDLNGDGLDDVAAISNGTLELYLRHGTKPDLLTEAVGSFGPHSTVSYQAVQDATDDSCLVPLTCVHGGMWVVNELDLDDGVAANPTEFHRFTYTFERGRFDSLQTQFLGFARTSVFDVNANTFTNKYFDLSANTQGPVIFYPLAGLPTTEESQTWLLDGTFRGSSRTVQYLVRGTGPYDVVSSVIAESVGEVETDGTTLAVARNVTNNQQVDPFGNVLSRSWGPGGVAQPLDSETCSYENDVSDWRVANPTFCTETSVSAGGEQASRQTAFEYDGHGLLVRQTDDPDPASGTSYAPLPQPQPDGAQTHYTEYLRDFTGAPTMVTSEERKDGTGERRVQIITYDLAEDMFPVVHIDPLGHVNIALYHPGLGVVAARVDENGLTTTMAYDGFGRPRATYDPTGTSTLVSYVAPYFGVQFGSVVTQKFGATGTAGAVNTEVLDSLGRTQWTLLDYGRLDGRIVDTMTLRDYAGRVTHLYRPYFDLSSFNGETATTYDLLGRVMTVSYPDGALVPTTYRGPMTTMGDGQGNARSVTNDLWGRPVAALEGNGTLGTTMTYGPFDTLETVTDSGGSLSQGGVLKTVMYDRRGRPRILLDADAGPEELLYNAFGEVTHRILGGTYNGAHVVGGADTVIAHDLDGRVTSTTAPDVTATTVWDAATYGVGKVATRKLSGGAAVHYRYDPTSRLAQRSWDSPEGGSVFFGYDYDEFDRVLNVHYPEFPGVTPLTVTYNHAPGGQLRSIQNADDGTPYWRLEASDPTGLFQTAMLGNQVESSWSEDSMHLGLPYNILATNTAIGKEVQSLVYGWVGHSRLAQRYDAVNGLSDNFSYYPSHQLSEWQRSVQATQSLSDDKYNYSGLGNFTLQGESGLAPTYGKWGLHQPDSDGRGNAYGYDAHGNQTAAPGRTAAFNQLDLMTSVTTATGLYRFAYDGELSRVSRKDPNGNATFTYGGLFERRERPDGVHNVYKVPLGRAATLELETLLVGPRARPRSTSYVLLDHLGSADTLLSGGPNGVQAPADNPPADPAPTKFRAFGARVAPGDPTVLVASPPRGIREGFAGHDDDDDLDLVDMIGRVYDPIQGRFLSRDAVPVDPTLPTSMNPYAYVRNDPLNSTDPTGYESSDFGPPPDMGVTALRNAPSGHQEPTSGTPPGPPASAKPPSAPPTNNSKAADSSVHSPNQGANPFTGPQSGGQVDHRDPRRTYFSIEQGTRPACSVIRCTGNGKHDVRSLQNDLRYNWSWHRQTAADRALHEVLKAAGVASVPFTMAEVPLLLAGSAGASLGGGAGAGLGGTLTAAERAEIQAIADEFGTDIDVVGSRAAGTGRNIDKTHLPAGKDPPGQPGTTRSDIDFRIDGQLDSDTNGALSDRLKEVSNNAGQIAGKGLPEISSHPPVIRFSGRK
jgi:RHS repeat-associated protein